MLETQSGSTDKTSGPPSNAPPPKLNKTGFNMKIAAIVVVAVIIIGIVGYDIINTPFSPKIEIDPEDKEFYDIYPELPFEWFVFSGDVLWGEYSIWIHYNVIQTVQITPTIEDIAQQFITQYPEDVYERVNATYSFVSNNIDYSIGDIEQPQFPVTTLLNGKGNCGEVSALLASLLYAEGLHDVALVFTNGTDSPHSYVAVRLPTPTDGVNVIESQIKDYLGSNWIAMDPTSNRYGYRLEFRELNIDWTGHNNIQTILEVPIYGCVNEFTYVFKNNTDLGYYIDVQCGLSAIGLDEINNVTFTFQVYQNFVLYSTHKIVMASDENLTIHSYNFQLDYGDDFYENYTTGSDNWYFGLEIQYD